MDVYGWGGTAFQPPTIDPASFIPPVRVPATFGTYQGPSRNPIATGAVPSVAAVTRALPSGERRGALVRSLRDTASVAVARASHNAKLAIGTARSVGVRNNR